MYQEILQSKKIRAISVVFIAIIAIAIIITLAISLSHSGKIKVIIDFQPQEAIVYLNNRTKNINHSTIYLPEGEYNISAFLDNHYYQESTININDYNASITGQLIPTNATMEEFTEYLEQANLMAMTTDLEAEERLMQRFPLVKYLPYSTLDDSFYITYDVSADYDKLNVNIELEQKDDFVALNAALSILHDFDPNISLVDYDITINNFTNPFVNQFQGNNNSQPLNFLKAGFASVNDVSIQTGKTSGDYYYTAIRKTFTVPISSNEIYDESDDLEDALSDGVSSDELTDIAVDATITDYVPYLVVLKKQGNSWTLANTPSPILTTYNSPDIPLEILELANDYNWSENDE